MLCKNLDQCSEVPGFRIVADFATFFDNWRDGIDDVTLGVLRIREFELQSVYSVESQTHSKRVDQAGCEHFYFVLKLFWVCLGRQEPWVYCAQHFI